MNRSSLLLAIIIGTSREDGKARSFRDNSEGVVVPLLQHEALGGHRAPLNMHSNVLVDEQSYDSRVCVALQTSHKQLF